MKKEDIISKIDFAIIITVITGISYALTYLFKAGELIYYGIPSYFIDISAKDVFFTMLILSPSIIGLIFELRVSIFGSDKTAQDNKESNNRNKIVEAEESLNQLKIQLRNLESNENTDINETENKVIEIKKQIQQIEEMIVDLTKSRQRDIIKGISLLLVMIGILISILLYIMNKQSFILGVLMVIQIITILVVSILNKKRKYGILLCVIFSFLLILPLALGFNTSFTDKDFITFEDNGNTLVVLATYKDQFLYAPLDEKTNKYENAFNLKEIKDVQNFKIESIGNIQKQKQ
jgi:hypothetical protein